MVRFEKVDLLASNTNFSSTQCWQGLLLPASLKPAQISKSWVKTTCVYSERRRQRVLFSSHVSKLDFEYYIWYRAQSLSLLSFYTWDAPHFYQDVLDENNLKSASFVVILDTVWKAHFLTRVCLTRCYIHPGCYTIVPTVLLDLATEIITIHFRRQAYQSRLLHLSNLQLSFLHQ